MNIKKRDGRMGGGGGGLVGEGIGSRKRGGDTSGEESERKHFPLFPCAALHFPLPGVTAYRNVSEDHK